MEQNPESSRLSIPLALTIAILAVSTASILIRVAQRDAPSITIAALRLAFATLLLAPYTLTRHRAELRRLELRELLLAALSGAFLSIHFATWITSLKYTSVASSVVLVSTGPLWVALLSPLFLGERLHKGTLVGLALAIAGGIAIAGAGACSLSGGIKCVDLAAPSTQSTLRGDFLALAGAWAVSGYLIIGRRLRATMSLSPYIFLVYGFAALGLLAATVVTRSQLLDLPPRAYGWILLLAVVPQLIGHSTYNWALRYLPAAFVAITTLGEPVGSAILAYFLLGESPGSLVLIGGVLILAGIFLAGRGSQPAGPPSM